MKVNTYECDLCKQTIAKDFNGGLLGVGIRLDEQSMTYKTVTPDKADVHLCRTCETAIYRLGE